MLCKVMFGAWLIVTVAYAQEIDEVVLVVDDVAITRQEYSVLYYIQMQADRFEPVIPEIGSVGTERIVDDMLLAEYARRVSPDAIISDAQVSQAIQSLASRNQLSGDQLMSSLQSQGIDILIFRDSMRQRLLVQQVVGQGIASRIKVSPAEVTEYIESRPELRSIARKTFRASHIVIAVEDDLNRSEIKDRSRLAEDIRVRLIAGEEMAGIAQEYEFVSASGDKGDLGWKTEEDLPELFVKALDTLSEGGTSAVLESSNGFHLLVLTEVKSASTTPQEYHIRHIAKSIPAGPDVREQAVLLQNLKFQILAGLDFAGIARAQSDDAGSADNGGDLGWVQLADVDPDFAKAVGALEIGEISDPVRSPYGVHIIQLLQIRAVSGSATLESQVEQRIFTEKLDEKMQDLLNNLRQTALIEAVNS
jgi:peptidyl-prolyl cis-trans isomerase SurA